MNNVSVVYELDNAISRDDRIKATNSFRSVLMSSRDCESKCGAKLEIVIVGDSKSIDELGGSWSDIQKEFCSNGMTIRWITAYGLRYFDKKALGAVRASYETVVFADSDCCYSINWVRVMACAVWSNPSVVYYGSTYATESPQNEFEYASRFCWLFPPISFHQNISHGRKWGNNFACKKALMLTTPFPSLNIVGYPSTEFKIERVLWERILFKAGIESREIDTEVFHEQISSLKDWLARHYIHGQAAALGDQISGAHWKAQLQATWILRCRNRRRELGKLKRESLIDSPLYLRTIMLTFLADVAHVLGRLVIIARRPEVFIDWRLATSGKIRWEETQNATT